MKLRNDEIDLIVKTYKELKSIQKTSKELGFCKNTVNKYVREISSKDTRSRYNNNTVLKIDIETNTVIKEFKNSNVAAKESNLSLSTLNKCLNNVTKTSGGFRWTYKNTLDKKTI